MANRASFWDLIEYGDWLDCWPYRGSLNSSGYGPHRKAYEELAGPVPAGHDLDHLCRRRSCMNPLHLEPVTRRENLRRGAGPTGRKMRQTHCVHGHPFDKANTYAWRGRRYCRACRAERDAARA